MLHDYMVCYHVVLTLAVLEKREAWLPRLCYWMRRGEGKGETGEGTVDGRERVSRERNSRDPTDRRLPALN